MTTPAAPITVIGGGLAGCEAAWQLLRRRYRVRLCEMKPERFSPAHKSPLLAELVCSNSLRSNSLDNAVGLLKEELRRMDSLIMAAADATAVPAGKALAVDRTAFSRFIEERLAVQPDLELIRGEITEIPETGVTIVATGPLTSEALAGRSRHSPATLISISTMRSHRSSKGNPSIGAVFSPLPAMAAARRTT